MIKRDLLQRQIEELGKMLGKVTADFYDLKAAGGFGPAVEAATRTLNSRLDLDVVGLVDLERRDFLDTLRSNKGFSHENLEKFGEILFGFAEGDSIYDKSKLYEKCLAIYEFLEQDEKIYSFQRRARIAQIRRLSEGIGTQK